MVPIGPRRNPPAYPSGHESQMTESNFTIRIVATLTEMPRRYRAYSLNGSH